MHTDSAQLRAVDPRTPVMVGVGQVSEQIGDSDYRALSAVGLAAEAAREAIADSGAGRGLDVGVVAAVRQFENSSSDAIAPLGRSDNFPRSVADRLGCKPARAVLEVSGGQSPQKLLTEFAGQIAAGDVETVLLVGAEAISTCRHFNGREDAPDFTERRGGQLEDRGFGLDGLISATAEWHGLVGAPMHYAVFEHARRARLGLTRDRYATLMGELFAPFSAIAAGNEHAAVRTPRSAEELVATSDRNRIIADPYPRFLVARDQVNQGAAVLLTSVEHARRLGVDRDRMVFLQGHCNVRERPVLQRSDLGANPAAVAACAQALRMAQLGIDDVEYFDLYSCFPIAVFGICDGLGLDPGDRRGLTVTGGLPFFGGPGNNYSMHGIVEMAEALRSKPGAIGLIGANGGVLSKYSAGLYSTTPTSWRPAADREVADTLAQLPPVVEASHPEGPATIDSFTIGYAGQDGRAAVIGRDAEGGRFYAAVSPDDSPTHDLLRSDDAIGASVVATTVDGLTWISADATALDHLKRGRASDVMAHRSQ